MKNEDIQKTRRNCAQPNQTRIRVLSVSSPPMSTIGFGSGTDLETGNEVLFCGDQRCLREIGEALLAKDEPVEAEIEDWQVLSFSVRPSVEERAR